MYVCMYVWFERTRFRIAHNCACSKWSLAKKHHTYLPSSNLNCEIYRRVRTGGKWEEAKRLIRWRSSNGLEAAQIIHSFRKVESYVYWCFDSTADCYCYRRTIYNNLRLLSDYIQLPISWHGDNSWESTMDQNIVWCHRLCFPALVVLWRHALTFSTISGNGVKRETVPCSFSSVFFGCNLSCGSSTPWDIAF